MNLLKDRPDKNRVYIQCSETERKVKATILKKDDRLLQVEMPTGFVLTMQKRNRRTHYSFKVGIVEFHSDGKPVV